MSSEHTGSPDPLVRLAAVLAGAGGGAHPTPRELAELLWLARHMEPGADDRGPEGPEAPAPPPAPAP
ncbi:hypothetical protein GT045_30590, partial [Streptomyces sp. SID486]|uniref:hypothetical protein n=1 Tax=Streptomyces sp. SID486 TaxID=2690264 RepID=UPI0013B8F1F9